MDEQSYIFDDQFNENYPVRRRQLLSTVLKVYLWIGMMGAVMLALWWTFEMGSQMFRLYEIGRLRKGWLFEVVSYTVVMLPICYLFLMTFLVWKEVKWAIKFNILAASLFLVFMVIGLSEDYLNLTNALTIIVIVPYFILLFRIQKKWEK